MAQKTLWHSELAGMNQIEVTVKSEARKSKYQGKPDYVELVIGGTLRHYQVENPSCGEFFKGRGGQTILIEARDSRENASIHLMAPARGQQPPAQPTNVSPKQQPTTNQPPASTRPAEAPVAPQAPPGKTAEQMAAEAMEKSRLAIREAKKFASRKVNAFELIFRAVDHLADRRSKQGRALTPEHYQGIVTSIFIAMDRAGVTETLPIGELDKYLPEEQPKP